jgi:acyl carrier protein
MISELKELMRHIGMDDSIVQDMNPAHALAGKHMDSADYPVFLDAIEERCGITVDDGYALKRKTLIDFVTFMELQTGRDE